MRLRSMLFIGLMGLAGCADADEADPARGEALAPLPAWAPTGFACERTIPVGGCLVGPAVEGLGAEWTGEGTVTAAGRGATQADCAGGAWVGLPFSGFDASPFATWFEITDEAGQVHRVVFRAPAPLDVRVGDALRVTARRASAADLYVDGGELIVEDAAGLVGYVEFWSSGTGYPGLEAEAGEALCTIDQPDRLKITGYKTDVRWGDAEATLGWGEQARLGDLVVIASGAVSTEDPYEVSQEGCHACGYQFGFSAARAVE